MGTTSYPLGMVLRGISNLPIIKINCFRYSGSVKMMIIELEGTINDTVVVAKYSRKRETVNGYMQLSAKPLHLP